LARKDPTIKVKIGANGSETWRAGTEGYVEKGNNMQGLERRSILEVR
jgi:hypothetical protein